MVNPAPFWRIRRIGVLIALLAGLFAVDANAQTVSGTVREADNGPLLRSMVVAAYTPAGILQANTTTNTSGHYDLALPAGQYRVLAYDPTGAHATQFANDAPSYEESPLISVASGVTVPLDFALPKGITVTGTVNTSGGPRAGVIVAAYNLSGTRRGFATTNGAGTYSLALPAGAYKFVAYDDAGAFAPSFFRDASDFTKADIVTLTVGKPAPSIDFFLQLAARVSGIATDSNGVPLANISILAYTSAGQFVSFVTTGPDGRFTMSLVPGSYRFIALDPAFVYAAAFNGGAEAFELAPVITVSAGQLKNDLTFQIQRGGLVQGVVTDATTGAPLAGITVAAYNTDGSQRTFVVTDANGRYVLLLPAGDFRIAAFDPKLVYATQFYQQQTSFARASSITPSVGQTMTITSFALAHGGRVSGTITDQVTHIGIANAVVLAYDSTGVLVGQAIADSSGVYHLVLPPGTYRLVAADPQLRYAPSYSGGSNNFDQAAEVTVTTDKDTASDFTLRRGTFVTGTATNASTHAAISGVQVTALDANQNRVATAITANDGSFQLSLVPGAYKFLVTDPAGRYATTYYGGTSFSSAPLVSIDATGAPRINILLKNSSRRRAVHH